MAELKRILHIEDDPSILEVARLALELVGHFEVCSCASGTAGLAAAVSFAPQLILLDVMMPEMDGPQTLAALRQYPETRDIPIVLMTARAQSSDMQAYEHLRVAGVIIKPFDAMQLAGQIRQIWEQQHG